MPHIAPRWFGCFDATTIGDGLESGAAIAFLGEKNVDNGVDRGVAVFGDGRACAWDQLNNFGETANDGSPGGKARPGRGGCGRSFTVRATHSELVDPDRGGLPGGADCE